MDDWRQYFFSIIVCSLSCGIVSQIISDSKRKDLMRFVCGIVMAIVILKPLIKISPETSWYLPEQIWDSADYFVEQGETAAMEARSECIKASCEAYILDKAKAIGTKINVMISLNDEMIPVFAEISGAYDSASQGQLQEVRTMDLGIPK